MAKRTKRTVDAETMKDVRSVANSLKTKIAKLESELAQACEIMDQTVHLDVFHAIEDDEGDWESCRDQMASFLHQRGYKVTSDRKFMRESRPRWKFRQAAREGRARGMEMRQRHLERQRQTRESKT